MTVTTPASTSLYPARTGPRPVTAEDLWNIPRVGAPVPALDGSFCIVPVTTYDLARNEGRGRLWRVPADGGEARPLTTPEVSSGEPALSPDGARLVFTRRIEKGKPQLYLMPLDGGEALKLTDFPLGVFDPCWLPDGSGIVFAATLLKGHLTPEATQAEVERRDKNPVKAYVTEDRLFRFWDTWLTTGEVPHLFVFDLASGKSRDLTPENTCWFDWMDPSGQYDIAPDGSEVAFSGIAFDEARSLIRSDLYRVPMKGGEVTRLTGDDTSDNLRPRYSPDGRSIVYGMTVDPYYYADPVRVMALDRASGKSERWFESWNLSPARWTFDREGTLFLEAEEEGRISLFAGRGAETPKRLVRGGTVAGAAPAGGKVFYTLQSTSDPAEVHVAGADGGATRRLTRFTDEVTSRYSVGEVRELRFEGAYGEAVQMYLVLPPGYREGTRYPLIQQIHGGPHAMSGDTFHFRWNSHAFAAPGYVVALVNFQGSTSWGDDFARRIQGGWGDRPYQDVMKATDHLIALGYADEKRMAAAGGSYGGYMASWIEGHTDRFRCIVNHAGVYDTLSQYASDVTQGRAQSFGGEPWDGLVAIDRFNPARFAGGFKTPMLVLHGERDYRVPVTQGLECYSVLKAKGIPARLVYFPDENHWVLKAANSLLWYREVMSWFERFLGK